MKLWLKRIVVVLLSFVLLLSLLLVLSVLMAKQQPANTPSGVKRDGHFWITNVNVYRNETRDYLHADIEIIDGRIATVTPYKQATIRDNVKLDGDGMYVTPGLIDAHVHVFDAVDMQAYLSYGVTSVRNMMGFPFHLRLKQALLNGDVLGPNFTTSTPTINSGANGGPFHAYIHSEMDVIKRVRDYHEMGFDFVKFYDGLSASQYQALVKTANELGMGFSGHVPSQIPLEEILASSPTSIEHIEEVFNTLLKYKSNDEVLAEVTAQLVSTQTPIVTTWVAYNNVYSAGIDYDHFMHDESRLNAINGFVTFIGTRMLSKAETPDYIDYLKRKNRYLGTIARTFSQQGVLMALGSDSGPALTVPGYSLHKEIALMADIGISAQDIIQMATVNAAQVLNIAGVSGEVEPGSLADMVVTEKDPLKDVTVLSQPEYVVANGVLLDKQNLKAMREASTSHTNVLTTIGLFIEQLLFV
ncbi:amidohydrolase family protein [Alteromonas facilis]|uniref:amidohydrolase family protein n=1 Tax=Alteromonas facilis TaxID=2048004 RepID=UPI000C294012|nr:amidohydrolase family protein [Alteromonas facilis]